MNRRVFLAAFASAAGLALADPKLLAIKQNPAFNPNWMYADWCETVDFIDASMVREVIKSVRNVLPKGTEFSVNIMQPMPNDYDPLSMRGVITWHYPARSCHDLKFTA